MAAKRGLNFKTPADVRKGASRIMNAIIKSNDLTDCAGKYASVAHVWLKSWELEQISDLERRLREVEKTLETSMPKTDERPRFEWLDEPEDETKEDLESETHN